MSKFSKLVRSMRARAALVCLAVCATALMVVGNAFATETPSEVAIKSITSTVNTEGSALFLVVVAGVASLFALLIAVTLGMKKIKTFIK
jgi:hypothetical protein